MDACHAIALQPNLQRSASHSLVGWSTLRPRLTRHPASPRPHAANEENAALRKAIEDADYECGVGLLRLNQLDLVTVVASPATVRRSATVPSPGATHLAIWTSSMRSPLPYRSRRGATVLSALSVDNDSARGRGQRLAGGDDKHSQPNAEIAKGRQVRMAYAPVDSTPWMDLERHRGWRCSTRTAAMAPRCACTTSHTNLLLSAALHDLTPHLLSIASSGSPECRMRCAIAHF